MRIYCIKTTARVVKRNNVKKNHRDVYCLKCPHCFRTEKKVKSHKTVCENKDVCNIVMPFEDTKI